MLLLRAWLETRLMLALHSRLGVCPVLALPLHQTKNKARWKSSMRPQIQVRTLDRFSEKPGFNSYFVLMPFRPWW